MNLICHDTTGTQTDCTKPLSRKKLRQLCHHNKPMFTSKMMEYRVGRMTQATKKRIRETEAEQKREKALQLAGVPPTDRGDESTTKTTVFKRMSEMFAKMTQRSQRKKAKGK